MPPHDPARDRRIKLRRADNPRRRSVPAASVKPKPQARRDTPYGVMFVCLAIVAMGSFGASRLCSAIAPSVDPDKGDTLLTVSYLCLISGAGVSLLALGFAAAWIRSLFR